MSNCCSVLLPDKVFRSIDDQEEHGCKYVGLVHRPRGVSGRTALNERRLQHCMQYDRRHGAPGRVVEAPSVSDREHGDRDHEFPEGVSGTTLHRTRLLANERKPSIFPGQSIISNPEAKEGYGKLCRRSGGNRA